MVEEVHQQAFGRQVKSSLIFLLIGIVIAIGLYFWLNNSGWGALVLLPLIAVPWALITGGVAKLITVLVWRKRRAPLLVPWLIWLGSIAAIAAFFMSGSK